MVPTTEKNLKRPHPKKIEKGIHVTQNSQIIVEVYLNQIQITESGVVLCRFLDMELGSDHDRIIPSGTYRLHVLLRVVYECNLPWQSEWFPKQCCTSK